MRAFFNQLNSLIIALLFAIIVWAFATSEQNPIREGYLPDLLPIETVNRPDEMLISQKVENVRLKLRAPQVSWDQLTPASFRVMADLQSLGAGEHQIQLKVQSTDSRVSIVAIEPATINVRLEKLKVREFDLRSEVLDAPPLGYAYRTPVITPARVVITGSASLVDQVVEAAVDIYLRGAKSTIDREIAVVPRDGNGNVVLGLTISPTTALVKVPVEQRVGYKDVSIKAALKGTVAPGYWISNIIVAPSAVTLAGNPDILAKIPGFVETAPVDVNGATSEMTKRAAVALPEGVSILNNEGITVQVSVTPIMGGQTIRRKITLQGLRRGLSATISPDTVEIILSGPLPSLQSLSAEDVQVMVDASTLGAGIHQLKPRVPVVPDALKVQSIVPDIIQITIIDVSQTPTVNPTPNLTPSPAPSPTPGPSPTHLPTPTPTPTR